MCNSMLKRLAHLAAGANGSELVLFKIHFGAISKKLQQFQKGQRERSEKFSDNCKWELYNPTILHPRVNYPYIK